jgi:hypothetical protein
MTLIETTINLGENRRTTTCERTADGVELFAGLML